MSQMKKKFNYRLRHKVNLNRIVKITAQKLILKLKSKKDHNSLYKVSFFFLQPFAWMKDVDLTHTWLADDSFLHCYHWSKHFFVKTKKKLPFFPLDLFSSSLLLFFHCRILLNFYLPNQFSLCCHNHLSDLAIFLSLPTSFIYSYLFTHSDSSGIFPLLTKVYIVYS